MRWSERWAALPWGVYGAVLAAVMGAIGLYSLHAYPEERPSARAAAPLYGLGVYWVLALLCNRRSTRAGREGVRVTVWPLPVRPRRRVKREEIRHCYVREDRLVDEGEVTYSVGVETAGWEQVEVSRRVGREEAERFAGALAAALNEGARGEAIGVRNVDRMGGSVGGLVLVAVAWTVLLIAAILGGFAWESGWWG